jgi:hypothetical protein
MSALGQKQTLQRILLMSALPPKADIGTQSRDGAAGSGDLPLLSRLAEGRYIGPSSLSDNGL